MNGRVKFLTFIGIAFFSSIHAWAFSDEELIKFIDQRNYQKVVDHFNAHPGRENLVLKAHAQMGLADFEPLSIIQRIRAPQVPSSGLASEYFFRTDEEGIPHCPNVQIANRYTGSPKCLVLRFFNQIPRYVDPSLAGVKESALHPHYTHPSLLDALSTFRLLHSQGLLGRQDQVLYSIVELSLVFSKLRTALYQYNAMDERNVSYDELASIIASVRSAAEDFEIFLSHYKDIEVFFQHQIFGAKVDYFFQTSAEGKVEFLLDTGIPMFFRVTDLSKNGTVEAAGRTELIKAIDRVDYFFRSELQEFPSL